jgi:hypothetical protein
VDSVYYALPAEQTADAADGIATPPAKTPPVTAAATATLNRTMKTPRNAFRAVPPVQDRQAGKVACRSRPALHGQRARGWS